MVIIASKVLLQDKNQVGILFLSHNTGIACKKIMKRGKREEFGALSPARLFYSLQMGKAKCSPRVLLFLGSKNRI